MKKEISLKIKNEKKIKIFFVLFLELVLIIGFIGEVSAGSPNYNSASDILRKQLTAICVGNGKSCNVQDNKNCCNSFNPNNPSSESPYQACNCYKPPQDFYKNLQTPPVNPDYSKPPQATGNNCDLSYLDSNLNYLSQQTTDIASQLTTVTGIISDCFGNSGEKIKSSDKVCDAEKLFLKYKVLLSQQYLSLAIQMGDYSSLSTDNDIKITEFLGFESKRDKYFQTAIDIMNSVVGYIKSPLCSKPDCSEFHLILAEDYRIWSEHYIKYDVNFKMFEDAYNNAGFWAPGIPPAPAIFSPNYQKRMDLRTKILSMLSSRKYRISKYNDYLQELNEAKKCNPKTASMALLGAQTDSLQKQMNGLKKGISDAGSTYYSNCDTKSVDVSSPGKAYGDRFKNIAVNAPRSNPSACGIFKLVSEEELKQLYAGTSSINYDLIKLLNLLQLIVGNGISLQEFFKKDKQDQIQTLFNAIQNQATNPNPCLNNLACMNNKPYIADNNFAKLDGSKINSCLQNPSSKDPICEVVKDLAAKLDRLTKLAFNPDPNCVNPVSQDLVNMQGNGKSPDGEKNIFNAFAYDYKFDEHIDEDDDKSKIVPILRWPYDPLTNDQLIELNKRLQANIPEKVAEMIGVAWLIVAGRGAALDALVAGEYGSCMTLASGFAICVNVGPSINQFSQYISESQFGNPYLGSVLGTALMTCPAIPGLVKKVFTGNSKMGNPGNGAVGVVSDASALDSVAAGIKNKIETPCKGKVTVEVKAISTNTRVVSIKNSAGQGTDIGLTTEESNVPGLISNPSEVKSLDAAKANADCKGLCKDTTTGNPVEPATYEEGKSPSPGRYNKVCPADFRECKVCTNKPNCQIVEPVKSNDPAELAKQVDSILNRMPAEAGNRAVIRVPGAAGQPDNLVGFCGQTIEEFLSRVSAYLGRDITADFLSDIATELNGGPVTERGGLLEHVARHFPKDVEKLNLKQRLKALNELVREVYNCNNPQPKSYYDGISAQEIIQNVKDVLTLKNNPNIKNIKLWKMDKTNLAKNFQSYRPDCQRLIKNFDNDYILSFDIKIGENTYMNVHVYLNKLQGGGFQIRTIFPVFGQPGVKAFDSCTPKSFIQSMFPVAP